MGFFSKLFGNKQKNEVETNGIIKPALSTHSITPDLLTYENVVDNIAISKELQTEVKTMIKQAFQNPKSFYDESNEFILSDRGLTYPKDSNLTPKFVFVDKMISAGQMTEVDWKEEEEEIRLEITKIAEKKGYHLPLSAKIKYTEDTSQTLLSINDKELEPMGYCLQIFDINSDSYVFTIVPLNKKQLITNMFNKLK